MLIFVKTLSGTCTPIHVELTDTISDLKETIHALEGYEPHTQSLVFQARSLSNHMSLSECGISVPNSIVYLTLTTRTEAMIARRQHVFVKTLLGKLMRIEYEAYDTVRALKLKVERQTGVGLESQRLVFNGAELNEETDMLGECGVEDGSVVYLVLKTRERQGYLARMSFDIESSLFEPL
jgi:hypothetical protein